jgi:hypothetical protein
MMQLTVSAFGIAPNNGKQPPTKIEKQMCSDAAHQFVTTYNQKNGLSNAQAALSAGGGFAAFNTAGAGQGGFAAFFASAKAATGNLLLGMYFGVKYNSAVNNTLYSMAYDSCMGNSNIPWTSFTSY